MRQRKKRVFDTPPPVSLPVPKQSVRKMGISIPKVEYKVVAQPILEQQFEGNVTVIPTVLIFFLKSTELKMVCTIIQEVMEHSECLLTADDFAKRHKITIVTVYNALYALRKLGIIYEHRLGRCVSRAVDFSAIQRLDDLLDIEDRGVYIRLRNITKLKPVYDITSDDVKKAYDLYVLPPDHDVEEEEEYD